MTPKEIKQKRTAAGIPGSLVSQKARISRSRLSDFERGYAVPSPDEIRRLSNALTDLMEAKRKLARAAAELGWPGDDF